MKISDDVKKAFDQIKLGSRGADALKYVIYRVNPELTHIVVEKTSNDPSYANFVAQLPEVFLFVRYMMFDFLSYLSFPVEHVS